MKNKRTIKYLLYAVLSLILVFGVYIAFFNYAFSKSLDHAFSTESWSTTLVNEENWPNLKEGMDKTEVEKLLGNTKSKFIPDIPEDTNLPLNICEMWQYNFSSSAAFQILNQPDPRAYVVYFDKQGKLFQWRAPVVNALTNQ